MLFIDPCAKTALLLMQPWVKGRLDLPPLHQAHELGCLVAIRHVSSSINGG